jgi:ABC-type sugar transport system ATPase subunit
MAANARALVARLGLDEISDVTAPVSSLRIAQRQLVEIARALSEDVRILVLDEPTSSLSEEETEALFATLRRLRGAGVGIIYISHRMAEIRRLADRITVLRDGKSIGTQAATAVDTQELVRWMVGREVSEHFPRPERGPGEVALRVENLHSEFVHGVSFELRYGEVLGIAGLVGSGRSELARALFGIDRLKSGAVYADGRRVRIRNPRDALAAGIVLVPEDRQGTGLVMMQSVAFNIALPWVEEWNPWGFPNAEKRRGIVDRAVDLFGIKVANVEHPVSDLSGGNQQKVLVSRWMEHRPKVLILDEPTRGVDVGAREEMFRVMGELVREGMAVLLISSDLVEVSSMSHRIAVYRDGQVLDVVEAEGTSLEHVMELLTGVDAV